jgi:uncharacterized membrane protein (UPF0182 family)
MRTPQDLPRRFPRTSRRLRIGLIVGVVLVIVLVVSLRGLASFWVNYLWFESVGFTSVFRGVLLTKWVLALTFTAIFFFLMWGNLYVTGRVAPPAVDPAETNELTIRFRDFAQAHGRVTQIGTSLIFAVLAGVGANREWNNWDLFRYHVSFGQTDPEYHKDIGFYVFQLPFIEFLVGWFFEAMVVVLLVTVVFHYLYGGITPQSSHGRVTSAVKAHVSVLLGVLALIKAVDYYYQRLALVLSRNHVVDGATATSVHADKPARLLLMVIAIIAAVLFLANIRQRGWVLPAVAVAVWVFVGIIVGDAYPAIYQALRVNPSELTKETPYIANNIAATQAAYGLSKVQVANSYNYTPTVTDEEIQGKSPTALANQQTLANVRLLDPAVNLLNTFDQYDRQKQYYSFSDLDPDRYDLDIHGTTQETATVTLIRELNASIPSGFVNQHLQYTHGYGAVIGPISETGVKTDGTPLPTLSQLPPVGQPQLVGNGNQIYFGEGADTGGYVIADTKTPEVDYESSNNSTQVTNHYAGTGGVAAGSIVRRAAFALTFGDPNFILSGQINPSSRVLYNRNIVQRAQKAAPFLKFDSDPYAVIVNRSVYWVLDAYTTTNNYPYSQGANLPSGQLPPNSGLNVPFNYVRNSVKVVIDAYNGSMHLFDMGTGDPILHVYERAFPDLFTPVSKANSIIPGIVAHFRYPEDIFQVQTFMYGRYHLTHPSDFYSQAQAWAVSPDPGSGLLNSNNPIGAVIANATGTATIQAARLQPQYVLAHLPGSTQQTFMLITPFVPISASAATQNLTAYMTASSDPSTYGTLTVFETPAGQTVAGPGLISNAIKTNPAISEELTFYNQQGSQVELGEVAIVPLDQSLLYVQPVYVESSTNRIPTLRDVVVVYNGTAYHSNNTSLDNALCQITNPDFSKPFADYCTTQEAARTQLPSIPNLGTGSSGSTTTTTAPSASTTVPPASGDTVPVTVPPGATVGSLLAEAQNEFASAQAALKAGDLQVYAADISKAESYVDAASKLAAGTRKP